MKNSRVTVVTDILLLILGFTMFVLAVLADKYVLNTKQAYNKSLAYKNNPYEDFTIGKIRCPHGYNQIYNYSFYGNEPGHFNKIQKEYKKGNCSSENLKVPDECFDIYATPRTALNLWHNSIICGKQYINWTKLYKNKIASNLTCPEGEKMCGIWSTAGDILCMKIKDHCPINQVIVKNIEPSSNSGLKSFSLDEDAYFIFGNQTNAKTYIPVDFNISNGYPCILTSRVAYTIPLVGLAINRDLYGCSNNNDPNYVDYRYYEVDTIKLKKYFNGNDMGYYDIMEDTKNWTNPSNEPITLFARPRIGPRSECENQNKNGTEFRAILDTAKKTNFTY